jgi:hypothetical protein
VVCVTNRPAIQATIASTLHFVTRLVFAFATFFGFQLSNLLPVEVPSSSFSTLAKREDDTK